MSEPLTPSRIAELRKLAEKATNGNWTARGPFVFEWSDPDGRHVLAATSYDGIGLEQADHNAAYAAAVHPQTVIALLDLANEALAVRAAASKYERCCDMWQDSLGTMHCRDCSQKTFAMFSAVQEALNLSKGLTPLNATLSPEKQP